MNDNFWINFILCCGIDYMFVIKKNGLKIFNFFFIFIKISFEMYCFYFNFIIYVLIILCNVKFQIDECVIYFLFDVVIDLYLDNYILILICVVRFLQVYIYVYWYQLRFY